MHIIFWIRYLKQDTVNAERRLETDFSDIFNALIQIEVKFYVFSQIIQYSNSHKRYLRQLHERETKCNIHVTMSITESNIAENTVNEFGEWIRHYRMMTSTATEYWTTIIVVYTFTWDYIVRWHYYDYGGQSFWYSSYATIHWNDTYILSLKSFERKIYGIFREWMHRCINDN